MAGYRSLRPPPALLEFLDELLGFLEASGAAASAPERYQALVTTYQRVVGDPEWSLRLSRWWTEHVGALSPARCGGIFKTLHDRYGLEEIQRVAAFYAGDLGPPLKNAQYFANDFVRWKTAADREQQPLVDADGIVDLSRLESPGRRAAGRGGG